MRFLSTELHRLMQDKYEIKENPIMLTEKDYKKYTEIIDEKYKHMNKENKAGYTFRGVEVNNYD